VARILIYLLLPYAIESEDGHPNTSLNENVVMVTLPVLDENGKLLPFLAKYNSNLILYKPKMKCKTTQKEMEIENKSAKKQCKEID